MSKMDWVPCTNYDTAIEVSTDTQVDLGLLNVESWSSDIEVIGDIEGEDQGFRVHRIVGFFSVTMSAAAAPTTGEVYVRLWPGFQDQHNQTVQVPGILSVRWSGASSADAGRAANEKWWWERICPVPDISDVAADRWLSCQRVNHPFSYMLDIKPRYYVSPSEVPCISILNGTDEDIFFWHRWRMLVSR